MLLVIDANIIFSALIAKGGTFKVFLTNRIAKKFQFVAPEYLFIEILEHFDELLKKTKLSEEELMLVLNFLEEQIKEFEDKNEKAEKNFSQILMILILL